MSTITPLSKKAMREETSALVDRYLADGKPY